MQKIITLFATKIVFLLITSITTLVFVSTSAEAGLIPRKVREIIKRAPKIPNPTLTPIQIATSGPKKYFKAQGSDLQLITTQTRATFNEIDRKTGNAAAVVGSKYARIVYEYSVAGTQFATEFIFTATDAASAILQGQDPLRAIAIPLAAALNDAYSKHIDGAKPLPEEVKELLRPIIDEEILNSARYTVADIKISLPNLISQGNKIFGHEYAVTINNLIIFSNPIDPHDDNDIALVAHELFHVRQYKMWGLQLFAFNYLKNYKAVEDQAEAAEMYARNFLQQSGENRISNPQIHKTSTTTFSSVNVETPLGVAQVYAPSDKQNSDWTGQPVIKAPLVFHMACYINGVPYFVNTREEIINFSFNVPVGMRRPPLHEPCGEDLWFNGGTRVCVVPNTNDPTTGIAWSGPQTAVGHCYACLPGRPCPIAVR